MIAPVVMIIAAGRATDRSLLFIFAADLGLNSTHLMSSSFAGRAGVPSSDIAALAPPPCSAGSSEVRRAVPYWLDWSAVDCWLSSPCSDASLSVSHVTRARRSRPPSARSLLAVIAPLSAVQSATVLAVSIHISRSIPAVIPSVCHRSPSHLTANLLCKSDVELHCYSVSAQIWLFSGHFPSDVPYSFF